MRPDALIDLMLGLEPLSDLPRTGWLLRGVRPAESIAEHSFGVAVVALALLPMLRARGLQPDGERTLALALLHDATEAQTGDVPLPRKGPVLRTALREVEAEIASDLLPADLRPLWDEAQAETSLEAKIVKAADKLQLMIKVLAYEARGVTSLGEFWTNPKNFDDHGLEVAREVFEAIRARGPGVLGGKSRDA